MKETTLITDISTATVETRNHGENTFKFMKKNNL